MTRGVLRQAEPSDVGVLFGAGVAEAGPFKNLEMIDSQRAASDDDRMGFVRNSNSKLGYACLDAAQVPRLSPWQVRGRPNSGLPTSM